MKFLLPSILLAIAVSALAEGQINFSNLGQGVDAPITNAAGERIVGPSHYVADLFWSLDTNAPMDKMSAVGYQAAISSSTINGGGYFFGLVTLNVGEIPVLVQVRVWDTNYALTYYDARNLGGEFGFSNLIVVIPDLPPGQPSPLAGLQGFQLQRLPWLTTVVTSTNTIVFSWPVEQTSYAVQQTADLPNNWTTLPYEPVLVGQQEQVTIPVPTTGRMFYRLVSQ